MNQRQILTIGAVAGGLSVAIGAFGAHTLKPMLIASERLDTFELAVRYQYYHTFALLISGVLMGQYKSKKIGYAALSFLIGILFFSGSLYALCFTGVTILGAITPIGGTLFIVGWMLLLLSVNERKGC